MRSAMNFINFVGMHENLGGIELALLILKQYSAKFR